MTNEIWKDISDFQGIYQVSNLGRIRRIVDSNCSRSGKIIKPTPQKGLYLNVTLRKNNKSYYRSVARLVATEFIGNPKQRQQVNHKDGNRQNNSSNNLEWVTCSENHYHAYAVLGRKPYIRTPGKNPNAKLTRKDVDTIRSLYSSGEYSQQKLADMFSLSQPTVSFIISRKSYKFTD